VSAPRLGLRAALLLAGACLITYANGLTGAFTYDDKAIVRDNFRIRRADRVTELFTTEYFGGLPGTGSAYRPVLLLSYAVQWWIHGGAVIPFHAVNLALHVLVTLLLAGLLLRLDLPPPTALGAALLFAVHPIHVEAVTSIVGRGETLAAAFVLGSLRAGLDAATRGGRRGLRLALALLFAALADLTKESAAIAPALLLLLLAWEAEGGLAARARSALVRGWPYVAGAAAVLWGVLRVRRAVLGGVLRAATTGVFEVENPLAPLPPLGRAANACALFLRALALQFLPLRLSADESAWSIRPLAPREAAFWAAPILLAALAAWALVRLRARSPAALGFLFAGIAALPTSNLLFPTGTIFAERLSYLPSAGVCLMAASWITGVSRSLAEVPLWRRAFFAAVALSLGLRTFARNPVWASDEALFTDMVEVSPASAKAHYDFAYMSLAAGRTPAALEHYVQAIAIYPGYWDAWAGRGRVERTLGRLADSERSYAEALRLVPTYENGFFGVGLAREDRGDRAGAERAYRDGLRSNPQSLPLAYRLALLLSAEGRPAALYAWRRALSIEPGSLPARLGYADWLLGAGRRTEAVAEIREMLRRAPRYAPALERLGALQR
jgi:protein O-mannosyl-transferase